jgi:microsomal epoxide hydrolase
MKLVEEHETPWLQDNARHWQEGMGYYQIQTTRPQTLAYGLADSPAGLCAWIAEKFHFWSDCERSGRRDLRNAISWDALLTNISLYWYTNTIASSVRLYREFLLASSRGDIAMPFEVPVPVGIAIYPRELFKIPRAWAERHYQLIHWSESPCGGHFAAMEQPEVFANDLRLFKTQSRIYL